MKRGLFSTAAFALLSLAGCGQNTDQMVHQQVQQDTIQDLQNLNNAVIQTLTRH